MGGRIDHAIANLNAVVTHAHLNLVLVGDKSTARLLPAGRSRVAPLPGVEGPHCSLVPLAGPCTITTTGLTWNMSGRPLPSAFPFPSGPFQTASCAKKYCMFSLVPEVSPEPLHFPLSIFN